MTLFVPFRVLSSVPHSQRLPVYHNIREYINQGKKKIVFRRRYLLGRAYLANGQLAEAVEMFTQALSRYFDDRLRSAGANVKAYYYLGIAYEESGWTDKAIEQYETFLNIWKDADPEIKEIGEARARLAKLRS